MVTALFCDLVGFTPLTERLDAEQVRAVQTAYFERMSEEIARFGGNVEKFAGDAVLALFGVPFAHGDDATRAVLCGLAMQSAMAGLAAELGARWNADLALRVGVNTGEAVSGLVDTGGYKDYSITGDVINTAARLQTAADPGGIMVGEETMRLARKRVRFGERRELKLKGKAQSVVAYPVLGERERLAEGAETRRRLAPLVGRDHELGILLQAWERASNRDGQLVTLVADAGVGKSRLLAEAVERAGPAESRREGWGRCLSYGQDVSLWLITDLLRSFLQVREQDDPERVQARLAEGVGTLLASHDDETRSAAVDVLGELLGLPVGTSSVTGAGAQVRRQVLIKSIRLMLLGITERAPTVMVLEDLHWIDSASAEVLSEVLADVPSLRLLVLASHRPGWTAPWAEWSWVERLHLRPLADRDAAALAVDILGGVSLSDDLTDYVAERAGGNPFFIEELLHVLQETGGIARQDGRMQLVAAAADRLPSTLTEIILARLDALDEDVRGLVQVASVIGRNFLADLLAHVTGRPVGTLESALGGLLRAEIAVPVPGGKAEYAFKHLTMRDVAYNTLLSGRRQALHAATAGALIALFGADESAEIVAYHYSRTDEHSAAAFWLERAGDRSADMYANQTAITHYEEARRRVELSGADPLSLARIGEKLGDVFRIVAWYDEALEELEMAAETYRAVGDEGAEARTVARISEVHFLRGASQQAIDRVRQVLDYLDDDPEDPSQARSLAGLYVALVDPLYSLNRFEDALAVAWRAVELARLGDERRLLADVHVRYGLALKGIGRLDEARQVLGDAIPLAEAAGDLSSLARALVWYGDICVAQGRPAEGRAYYERAIDVDENRGDLAETASLLGRLGQVAFILGEWDTARGLYERSVELVRSISLAHFSASALMTLGEHYLLEGSADEASRYLEEPITIAERSGQTAQLPYLEIPLAARDLFEERAEAALSRLAPLLAAPRFETALDHRAMQIAAEAYIESGDLDSAQQIAEQGGEYASGQTNRLASLGWLQIDGLLAASENRWDEALRHLGDALALARQIPYPYEEARILYRLGMLARSSSLDGDEHMAQARTMFEQLGARPHVDRIRRELEEPAQT